MLFDKFVTEVTQDAMVGMQVQPEVRKRAIKSASRSEDLTINRPSSLGSCAVYVRKPPRLLDL